MTAPQLQLAPAPLARVLAIVRSRRIPWLVQPFELRPRPAWERGTALYASAGTEADLDAAYGPREP